MTLYERAIAWLSDPAQWAGPVSIPSRIGEHLWILAITIAISAAIAIPLGLAIGHFRRGQTLMGALTGAARAVPTLGILTLAGLVLGIGIAPPIVALVALALPSLLAGAYSGVQAVDPELSDAAKALGMTPLQVVTKVELPLALPVIVGGVRSAVLQVIATATLAAYTADLGLGRFIMHGLKANRYEELLGSSIIVITLALLCDLFLSALQRATTRAFAPQRRTHA